MRKSFLFGGLVLLISVGFSMVLAEDCPPDNVITTMTSHMQSFQDVSPIDYKTVKSSGALLKKDGTKLTLCLSNGDFTIQQMTNDFVLPIKKKEEYILQISFMNAKNPVTVGEYSPKAGYGKPFWTFAEVKLHQGEKGVVVSFGVNDGVAKIFHIDDQNACGMFDLKYTGGDVIKGVVTGKFNVKVERSKY